MNLKRISFFGIVVIIVFIALFFHNSAGQKAIPYNKDGAFFALSVANYDSMVHWYSDNLGFNIVTESRNNYRNGALLSKEGFLLEIAHFNDAESRSKLKNNLESHQIHGIFKLGFLITDIDQLFEQVRNKKVTIFFPVVNADAGYKTFGIKDPEDNIIQFFEKNK